MSNPTAAPGIRGTAAEIVERAITGLRQAQTIADAKAAIFAITGQLDFHMERRIIRARKRLGP